MTGELAIILARKALERVKQLESEGSFYGEDPTNSQVVAICLAIHDYHAEKQAQADEHTEHLNYVLAPFEPTVAWVWRTAFPQTRGPWWWPPQMHWWSTVVLPSGAFDG